MRPEDVPIPPAGAMARTKGEDFFDGFIWICTFCGVGFALFFPTMPAIFWDILARGITFETKLSVNHTSFTQKNCGFSVVS